MCWPAGSAECWSIHVVAVWHITGLAGFDGAGSTRVLPGCTHDVWRSRLAGRLSLVVCWGCIMSVQAGADHLAEPTG
jgi:hypothetical protein